MKHSPVELSKEGSLETTKASAVRALHVDDDAGFLETAKAILEMQGTIQVETASSVEEAIGKMKTEKYDVVVCDYQMPQKDGLQFLKELRQKGNDIPFIIFTGKGREEVVIEAFNQGADHYENKNGNPETVYSELSHDIINAVRTRRAEQELQIQREELQIILDSTPAKIWYKDRNNRLVRVNKAFAEYMGVSKENLEGKLLCDLFPPDIAQKCWEEDKEVITTGQPKTDILDRHESAQGVRWFSTSKVPCREKDGNIIGTINFSVDITELKKAEEALAIERDRLEIVTESIGAGLAVISEDYRTLWANRVLKRIFGDVEGKICYSTYDRRNEICPRCGVREVFEAGKDRAVHEQVRKDADGKIIRSEIIATPIKDKSGKVTAAVELVVPVTERKKTEEALRESEEKFRSIFESATDTMTLLDTAGRILDVNKKAIEVYGGSKKELIGKHFTRICEGITTPTVIPKVTKAFAEALANKKNRFSLTIKNKKGQKIPLECSKSLLKPGNKPVGLLVIGRDVTERKRAEEELVRSERKYRSLVEQSLQGIVVAQGPTPHLVFANVAMSRILGYTPEELTSLSPQETIDLIHPEDRDVFFGRFKDRLEGKPTQSHYEVRGVRKDGALIWLELSSIRVEYNGQPAVQATFMDITKRKKAIEELEILNEKLGVVGKLTRHDIRNKLSAVTGNAYLAKKALPKDHQALSYITSIESACEQSTRILDYAAIYERLGVEEPHVVEVGKAFEEAVSLATDLHDIKIVNECHGLVVLADSLLKQLFYNLIDDSLRHGEKFSRISLHHKEGKSGLKLFYEDDGVGIAYDEKPKIFKGYSKTGTAGYGLTLIRRMMEVYGWTIEEKGVPGKGAEFVITIPTRTDSNQKQRYSNKKAFY